MEPVIAMYIYRRLAIQCKRTTMDSMIFVSEIPFSFLARSLPPSLNFQPRARACQIVLLLPLVPPTLLIFTFRQLSFQVIGGFNNSRTVVRHGRKILRDFRTENVLSESQPVQIRIETAPSKRSN